MKTKREFSGYPIANIREEIEKISKHFDDVLDLMTEAMVAEELKASDPTLSEDALKKRFEELRQQPDKLQELRDNELAKSFEKLKETVPHEFNGLDDLELTKKFARFKVHEYNRRLQSFKKEEVAKKFKEFKGQGPDTFNALKKDELTKLKKSFSDVSTLWDKKCTIMQEILSHTQIATVLVSLSDKIWLFRISCGIAMRENMGYSDIDKYIILKNSHKNVRFHPISRYRFTENNSPNH